jgi:hypothetical protein
MADVPARPGDEAVVLVRRHRPGRHRIGAPGLRHYRPARRQGEAVVRRRPVPPGAARTGRHAAHRRAAAADGAALARYASLAVVLSALLVSGWFAASGASAFAQMIHP